MKLKGLAGLCAFAVLVASAVLASAAQAEQFEFGQCAKAAKIGKEYQGSYSDKNCTTEVGKGGKYEFSPVPEGSAIEQAGKGKGGSIEVPGLGATVVCKKSTDKVIITGPKDGEGSGTFSGCAYNGESCQSETEGGSIIGGVIKWIKKHIKLDYEIPDEITIKIKLSLSFTCGSGPKVVVGGETDGFETGNVNVMSSKALDKWSGVGESLTAEVEGIGTFPAAFNATLAMKGPKLEIKAHP